MPINTENRYLQRLKELILTYVKNYPLKVILFGSHAKNTAHRYSDIDIALYSLTPLPPAFVSNLKEQIEESTIPYHVDLVDLAKTDEIFRNKVLNEGILWKD